MIKTTFLTNEDYNFKEFRSISSSYAQNEKFYDFKQKFFTEVFEKTRQIDLFYIKKGEVFLRKVNQIYCLDYLPYNADIVLPKPENIHDWVVLHYEQTTSSTVLSLERKGAIKIRGGGKRIMGLDEHLVCDMQFLSLRLTFLGDVDGWVVT